ncbi:PREDICTED: putative odorant receptor 85d isoform X2 [Vollenhovia emeryi]|nr:PREDICTED: putative odorant receptor 85d isoform X2 [Vollenhovia emeryi]XP_011869940.1 PREDICTED: putative odorant receptor 85d isoform X2 [Vollenhovia emeryi]XP_011869941.1 PREDICTED: putative odorant receptor 85d isoform X2 [Vollenhovia emeryi]
MEILFFNFLLYTISGLWRPVQWSSKRSKLLYNVFTFLTMYLLIYVVLTHIMYIILVVKNFEDLASCSFFSASLTSLLFKAITVISRRDQIINLIQILQEEPCKARDKEEIDIEMKFDRSIRSYSMRYIILCTFSITSAVIGGILYILEGQIPFGFASVPWDCTSFLIFLLTSIQEIVGVILGTIINVATETTLLGFCLQTCARFEILKHRLQKMIKHSEKKSIWTNSSNNILGKRSRLSEHVSHHLCIFRLAQFINDIFSQVIFVQFSTSALVLCSTIYYLSFHITVTTMATLTVYTFCMFVQIFYYCWAGNEVTLKSIRFSDEIYNMDWLLMTSSEQKDLLMIMKRSTRPIKFTSSFLVTLSLESFANILKASFSAFNILQQL